MSSRPSTTADASLISDVEFLEELERQEHASEPALDSGVYEDAFDALEAGLPVTRGAAPVMVPHHERAPVREPPVPLAARSEPTPDEWHDEPAPVGPGISVTAATIVIILCLSAGAASAALVFHDRVSRISALVTASR